MPFLELCNKFEKLEPQHEGHGREDGVCADLLGVCDDELMRDQSQKSHEVHQGRVVHQEQGEGARLQSEGLNELLLTCRGFRG